MEGIFVNVRIILKYIFRCRYGVDLIALAQDTGENFVNTVMNHAVS